MSLTFKLLSLAIRTAAKPIGNYIKRQAKEHDGFRKFAVAQAQRVHRIDMRMRLGILHDQAAQERMHEREQRAAEEKKRKAETPTVRTAEQQKRYEEEKEREEKEGAAKDDSKAVSTKVKIKPLSETRAIELGANFFSEAFIFGVAAGLLIWDAWRSRAKESARRDDVAERLEKLEAEIETLRTGANPDLESLKELDQRIKAAKESRRSSSWWNPVTWINTDSDKSTEDAHKDAEVSPKPDQPAQHAATASATSPKPAIAEASARSASDSTAPKVAPSAPKIATSGTPTPVPEKITPAAAPTKG